VAVDWTAVCITPTRTSDADANRQPHDDADNRVLSGPWSRARGALNPDNSRRKYSKARAGSAVSKVQLRSRRQGSDRCLLEWGSW